ncbi:MAG TPA: hypothetical protein VMZ71_12425, partial [Gemmataceae bacterium]|nr:hypothetical protein [Gemmataceae bacterium]
SPDERHLVYSAGQAAFRWDLGTGARLNAWPLQEGLSDQLIYAGPDKLYLFRQETADPAGKPFSSHHPAKYPRHCRIRNLLGADPKKFILDSPALSWGVQLAASSVSESCFVAEGSETIGGKPVRFIKAFDAATGGVLWVNDSKVPVQISGSPNMDPRGEFMATIPEPGRATILRVRTGKEVESSAEGYYALGVAGGFYTRANGTLLRRGENTPLFRLAIDDTRTHAPGMSFDPSGTRVAWVTTEGVVRVCDLTAARDRLAELGLNW